MPPVAQSIAQLLRRQAQSVLQTNTPLVIRSSLRQPLQQKRTIFSQQLPRTLKRRQPTAQRLGNRPVNRQQQTRFSSSSSSSASANETAQKTQQQARSLSQRLKDLSRQYGWSAVGVYFALSALDFPFCFAAVRFFGVERIGHYEHVVVERAKNWFYSVVPLERQIEGDQQQEQEHDDSHAIAGAEGATDEGASKFFFP